MAVPTGAAAATRQSRRVPAYLTPFVGRRRELTALTRLLSSKRLITLVGVGGVGKTRLAVEAARRAPGFDDGADLIDLSVLTEPPGVPTAVTRRLGLEERAEGELVDRLYSFLKPQRRLIVLDTCEHLTGPCAQLVTGLIAWCPGVVVLATSRQPLGVAGEVVLRVEGLRAPEAEQVPDLVQLEGFESVALFLDRVRAAGPGLAVSDRDAAAISRICRRLEGIPLALELAAARAGAMGLDGLAEHLSSQLSLLARAGSAARFPSLRASIEWSHRLLSAPEQALLRRCSVFAGGWSRAAAEEVCAGGDVRGPQVAVTLADLVDKSLVQAQPGPAAVRYRLLDPIRLFAAEQLACAGEQDAVTARHAAACTNLVEGSAPDLLGPGQADWCRLLDAEQENLRAANDWALAHHRPDLSLRLAAALWEYWHIRGLLDEGARWLQTALRQASGPPEARAAALNGFGVISQLRGDWEGGSDSFRRSIDAYRELGDLAGQSRAWAHLGNAEAICGHPDAAAEAVERARQLARSSGRPWQEAFALYCGAFAALLRGEASGAASLAARSSELFTAAGDRRGSGWCTALLGACHLAQGRPADAATVLRAALDAFDELPDRWGLQCGLCLLAAAQAALADWRPAATTLGVIDTLSERTRAMLFPFLQTQLDAVSTAVEQVLGQTMWGPREEGRAIGRRDGIAAALAGNCSQPTAESAGVDVLTPRENDVARLIAAGLTNRQIARHLAIAERTVDTHVSRILRKLSCTTRAQVASAVTRAEQGGARSDPSPGAAGV